MCGTLPVLARWMRAVGDSRGSGPGQGTGYTPRMPVRPLRSALLACSPALLLAAPWALAQQAGDAASVATTTDPFQIVTYDYARVLHVEPVQETIRATSTEQQCDQNDGVVASARAGLERVVGSVRRVITGRTPKPASGCRWVQVDHSIQRTIGYDVDYAWRGAKYRSRLADDPGSRLQIRIVVTPMAPAPTRPVAGP